MMRDARAERISELYEMLHIPDVYMTAEEVCDETGWSRAQFSQTVRDLRHALGAGDGTQTLLSEPDGFRQPWLYSIRDGAVVVNGEESRWLPSRARYIETALMTAVAVVKPGVRDTDGRSAEGKILRRLLKDLNRSLEDVAEVNDWATAS